jgi:hypothetical protein
MGKLLKKQKEEPEPGYGACCHCGDETPPDRYCYGCGEWVCDDCETNYNLSGGHHKDDHLEPHEDEDDQY